MIDGKPIKSPRLHVLCNDSSTKTERHTDTFFQSQPTRQIALRVALDLDVYNTLSADNGSPKSAAQLAAPKGADPVLVGES